MASSFVIRPPTPLPATLVVETPFSSKILPAAGEGWPEAYPEPVAAVTATGADAACAGAAAGDPSVISILQIKPPMGSVSFSFATILKIPLASAGNSKVALSDSTSAMTSSSLTKSPSFFIHVESVTSVMDSPTAGTFISFTPPVAFIG